MNIIFSQRIEFELGFSKKKPYVTNVQNHLTPPIAKIIINNKIENDEPVSNNEVDQLYNQALDIIRSEGKASTSFLQRKLQIGYNRAARIIDMMEEKGIVTKANHVGKREVL